MYNDKVAILLQNETFEALYRPNFYLFLMFERLLLCVS
jgi:hypothetical protein